MIHTLFPNNDSLFQEENAPIHTAVTVQSRIEEHEGELQHLLCPPQSPYLNIIEPVTETRVRIRFPPATSLEEIECVLQEGWYNIPLETVRKCMRSFQEELRLY
jgi:hypothetical protein